MWFLPAVLALGVGILPIELGATWKSVAVASRPWHRRWAPLHGVYVVYAAGGVETGSLECQETSGAFGCNTKDGEHRISHGGDEACELGPSSRDEYKFLFSWRHNSIDCYFKAKQDKSISKGQFTKLADQAQAYVNQQLDSK